MPAGADSPGRHVESDVQPFDDSVEPVLSQPDMTNSTATAATPIPALEPMPVLLPPGGTMTRAQPAIKQEAHGFASVSQPCGGKRRPSWTRTSLRISVTREIAERISV